MEGPVPEQGLLKFKEVVKPSGHSTLRLIVYDEAEVSSVLEQFGKLGCTNEKSHISGLIALDVPPSVSLEALRQVLDSGMAQGRWDCGVSAKRLDRVLGPVNVPSPFGRGSG